MAAVLASSAPASAAPKTPKAKAAFSAGVKAYQKGDYAAASKQLGKSFQLERDVETLFAWAQTERQLDHCDKASELYDKLLAFDLPAENKQAVQAKLDECKAILDAAHGDAVKPVEAAPIVVVEAPPPRQEPPPAPPPPESGRAWWKSPVGLTFVGLGLVAEGIGISYLSAGSSARSQADVYNKSDRAKYLSFQAEAKTDGQRGVAAVAVGGGFLAVAIVWFATHPSHPSHREASSVSAWLTPSSSGVAFSGRF